MGWELTFLQGIRGHGKAKHAAGPARKRQGRESAREAEDRVLLGGSDGRSHSSDRNKSDQFSRRRPPPIEEDFEAIESKPGASFEQARQAYKDAARKHYPDAGGDPQGDEASKRRLGSSQAHLWSIGGGQMGD